MKDANTINQLKLNKPMGKRTFTLKELAQKNFQSQDSNQVKPINAAPSICITQIQEDLLDDEVNSSGINMKTKNQVQKTTKGLGDNSLHLPIELIKQLIAKEISQVAKKLEIDDSELQAWVDLQVMTPALTLLSLLRIAKANNLDPLKEEVALALYEDTHWQAYISVEGYSKILNQHPAFNGITFTESTELANGIPIWMECAIFRKDRCQPIVVREYFEEVKSEQSIWQKMPRRMLRHRVLQQCARLAVG